MTNQSVKFAAFRRRAAHWVIEATLPNGKTELITGFLDEASTKNWLESEFGEHWLTSRGFKRASPGT